MPPLAKMGTPLTRKKKVSETSGPPCSGVGPGGEKGAGSRTSSMVRSPTLRRSDEEEEGEELEEGTNLSSKSQSVCSP